METIIALPMIRVRALTLTRIGQLLASRKSVPNVAQSSAICSRCSNLDAGRQFVAGTGSGRGREIDHASRENRPGTINDSRGDSRKSKGVQGGNAETGPWRRGNDEAGGIQGRRPG